MLANDFGEDGMAYPCVYARPQAQKVEDGKK